MAYSELADIEAEFKGIEFTLDSPVTDNEVDDFIDQSDAFIDAKIGLKYVVPITGTSSLLILKTISVWLTADRISQILEVKTQTEENSTAGKSLREMALEMLKEIVDETLLLSDATLLSTSAGFGSYASDYSIKKKFHRSSDEW